MKMSVNNIFLVNYFETFNDNLAQANIAYNDCYKGWEISNV